MERGTQQAPAPRGVLIRPATAADAEAIAALIERENGRPAERETIDRCLGTAPAMVLEDSGVLIGFIIARPFAPDILEWKNSLVATAHRRRGLGRALVGAMETASRQAGYRALIGVNCWKRQGATRERASAARAFWHAMGWTIVFATDGSAVVAKHL